MKRRTRSIPTLSSLLAVAVLAGAGPLDVAAQAPARAPAVVQFPAGARALGLGAFQPDANDSDAVFVNPAWASTAEGFGVGWHRIGDASTALTMSAATDAFGGGVALGVRTFSHAAGTFGSPPAVGAGGVDPYLEESERPTHETVATLAWGRSLLGIRVGIGASWIDQRVGSDNASTYAFDVGLATSLGPGEVGLAVRTLGAAPTFGESEPELPTEISLGWGAYGRPVGPLDLGTAVEVMRRADGEVVVGGGLEFGYWPVRGRTFVARVGARSVHEGEASPLVLGGSFWGDDLVLEYGWQPVDGTEGVHRVTLGWR
jgi:hypothetical protein